MYQKQKIIIACFKCSTVTVTFDFGTCSHPNRKTASSIGRNEFGIGYNR